MKQSLKIVFTIFFIITIQSTFAQCAMCKAVLESDSGLAKGVNDGILYLMAIPYILLLVIGFLIYLHYKKNKSTS